MTTPFDFVNEITYGKNDIVANGTGDVEGYVPFIVNKHLSNFADTVLIANEANRRLANTPKYQQFLFYLHLLPKRRRFAKWHKPIADQTVLTIAEILQVREEVAEQYIKAIGQQKINEVISQYNNRGGKGGKND